MGPQLAFDTFDDVRGRCAIAPVRLTGSEPGYDDAAIVPDENWTTLTAADAEHHRADGSMPASVRIELVRRPLPDLDPDDLEGRLEAAARLDPLNGRWPTELLGCTASPGNWATTTEDSSTGRRIGLHVDTPADVDRRRHRVPGRRLARCLGGRELNLRAPSLSRARTHPLNPLEHPDEPAGKAIWANSRTDSVGGTPASVCPRPDKDDLQCVFP
ncbi:hypothetical protein [Streptomyces sp. NPDC021020]|uniref:hypothetical protein n=1 Tax=Streptomyces sp. NPDC021020 TaxID=3365109 RepID=UPI00379E660D